jgi:Flp pilus assembly protein TadD
MEIKSYRITAEQSGRESILINAKKSVPVPKLPITPLHRHLGVARKSEFRRSLILLGCALHRDPETFAEAAAAYQRALQLQPDQFIALGNLGDVSLQMGRLEKARDALIKAGRINPNDSKLHALLGQVCLRLNRRDEALSELEILKLLDPAKAKELSMSLNQSLD